MIAEAEARVAADALAAAHDLCIDGRLIDGDRDDDRRAGRLWVYNAPEGFPAGWWIGLALPEGVEWLRSTEVIGVWKETGEARHLGSANDEG